jgi:serine/threonine-protein kinase
MEAGALLAGGKYRIEGPIGQGGMSTVYAARDTVLDRAVAIKLVQADTGDTPQLHERMFREARAVAQLESDHIVRILEIGQAEDGRPFIVMERLEGRDLHAHLASQGRLPYAEAVHYALQAAEGLAHAHQAGIVHRDIKPSNMFLARRANGQRVLKLLDFGIARGAVKGSITKQGLLGTPHYMSPEQMANPRDVDARTDVWALGVTLFQLVSGRLPFQGANLRELFVNVFESDAPRLAAIGVELPAGLDAAIARCLVRDRELRMGSVLELAVALAPFGPPDTRALLDEVTAASKPMAPFSLVPATTRAAEAPTTEIDASCTGSPLARSVGAMTAAMSAPTDVDPPVLEQITPREPGPDDDA